MLVKRIICAECGIRYYENDWKNNKCEACGGRLIEIEMEADYGEEDELDLRDLRRKNEE